MSNTRDERIVQEYTADRDTTLTEVGNKFDLSAERVRQILEEHGVTDNRRKHSKEFCLKELIKYYEQNDELPRSHEQPDEISCNVSLAYRRLGGMSNVIDIFESRFDSFDSSEERKQRGVKVSDEELIQALRDVCDEDNCSSYYYMENSPAGYPHSGTISNRFGSWNEALNAAGIADREYGDGRREERGYVYEDDELVSALMEVCDGEKISTDEYEERRSEDHPSHATIVRRLDRDWSELMDTVIG